jgi:hypothetical protein
VVVRNGVASVEMRENRRGTADQSVTVVRTEGLDGEPIAVLWSYACHPVSFPFALHVSADYPGVVRARFRDRLGDDVPMLFLQGFSGDLRPTATIGPGRRPAAVLDVLRNGRVLGRFSERDFHSWSESLAGAALSAAERAHEVEPALASTTRELALAEIFDGDTDGRRLRAQRLRLGDRLQIVALNAEPVNEYAAHVRRVYPGTETMSVGCVGDVVGYLPTEPMLAEGGYEVTEFQHWFSLEGRFRTNVERAVVDLVGGLAL